MPFAGNIWFEEVGSGEPILFLHGWCMSSKVWQLQMEQLGTQYRIIAPDLRGHGRSLPIPARSFADYGGDIRSLIEQLGLESLTLVGWSMGGQILLKLLPGIRERVSRVSLVSSTPRFIASPRFPFALPADEGRGMQIKVKRNIEKTVSNFRKGLFAEHELQDKTTAEKVEKVLGDIPTPSIDLALDGLERLMNEELFEEVRQIDTPTLLIHGELDRICLPEASKWLEQQIAGSRRICYPGCGHAPFLGRYRQFNLDLQKFITGEYD